jgi:5-methyltetrahydropteroyltriglutamate--homocysteine methyltransferase
MTIPTEPIGSIPRPLKLLEAINRHGSSHPSLEPLYDEAIQETIEQFEATGSPVVSDGEQRKYHNFATYCVEGLPNTAPDGFKLPFAAGHTRRWPRLTGGPFRFLMHGYDFLDRGMKYAHVPVKQAVISPSALSLVYPAENLPGYSREEFIKDLLGEHSEEERRHIGVHTCPGSDRDSTHSAEVDYAELLPSLFELRAGNFYIALAGEPDRTHVLKIIRKYLKPGQRIFIGVVSPIDPRVERPEEIRDRILEAARYISQSNNLEPRMTAVFHLSATTLRPRGKRRLRRFGRAWRERR